MQGIAQHHFKPVSSLSYSSTQLSRPIKLSNPIKPSNSIRCLGLASPQANLYSPRHRFNVSPRLNALPSGQVDTSQIKPLELSHKQLAHQKLNAIFDGVEAVFLTPQILNLAKKLDTKTPFVPMSFPFGAPHQLLLAGGLNLILAAPRMLELKCIQTLVQHQLSEHIPHNFNSFEDKALLAQVVDEVNCGINEYVVGLKSGTIKPQDGVSELQHQGLRSAAKLSRQTQLKLAEP